MADKKISALTGATTPLAGTEVLPIVQGSATVKVSVADLTAGRAVEMAGGSFTDNITQGTAAKGVNFTANTPAAGMTSRLLNAYEEGTWTPVVTAGVGSFTSYTSQGIYTKVGRIVTAWCSFQITDVGTGNTFCNIAGYPFTSYSSAAPSQQAGTTLYRENNVTGATGYATLAVNSTVGNLFGTFGNNYTFEFVMVYQAA